MTRCMVVDDSLFQRKNLGKMIVKMGWQVACEACNGRQAVEMYSTTKPDVVFMDLVMPEMEGIDALEKILDIPRLRRHR
jgi:two-component system chemotaxis response regulator CheY